jgi:arginine deiminase
VTERETRAPEAPREAPCGCAAAPQGRLFLASETDRLRACLLHAPGRELERLIPANYRWHLFDDLIYLERAQQEHARLSALLVRLGVRVDEFVDLLAEVYEQMSSFDQRAFLERMHDMNPSAPLFVLRDLSQEHDARRVARALVEGIEAEASFAAEVEDALYYFQPMANLIFMQDAAVVLLDRIVQGYMSQLVRLPEEVVVETVIRLSRVFGPRGSGEFWLDPAFRARHHMRRRVQSYLQIEAARLHIRVGEASGLPALSGGSLSAQAERVHLELESAHMADGRHFILEGGNILALRRGDGRTVVLVGHNARTSADAIDELAYRLLRPARGKKAEGEIAAVVVIDFQDPSRSAVHLDARLLVLSPGEIAVDRALVEPSSGPGARFYLFERNEGRPRAPEPPSADAFRPAPKVSLRPAPSLEDALRAAGLDHAVRWIPRRAPWETDATIAPERWVAIEQHLFNSALNALVVAPGVFIGLDRHGDFYRDELGAVCFDADRDILKGELSGLSCCALLDAIRGRAAGRPAALLLRGDELSRARGGPRSLVMPLVREPAS